MALGISSGRFRRCWRARRGKWLRDEEGITTVSMAVCIFLSLALIFSSAQLYRVQSAAAEIQEVADVAALAAENEVAEFMIAANTCDAAILSMTLLAGVVYGAAVVTACIPPVAELSAKLVEMGQKITGARDKFSNAACTGLNKLQKLLPFLSAANASSVASANNDGAAQAEYFALAVLAPSSGSDISVAADNLSDVSDEVGDACEELRDKSAEAEELAKEADEAKKAGYEEDCGNNPAYCMYERAQRLASLSGSDNPYYESMDAWSFNVALERAKSYYAARKDLESDFDNTGLTWEDRADSKLRQYYYEFAYNQLSDAVAASGDTCEFPQLFKNLEQLSDTSLYTENLFPITVSDGVQTMHAWDGCPESSGYTSLGSVSTLVSGSFATCDSCKFTATTFGNVASASTNIGNGFENHYQKVREACSKYNEVMEKLDPIKSEVEGQASGLLDLITDLLAGVGGNRIHAEPPGNLGAITMVVNNAQNSADAGFESLFVDSGQTLGTRAAVSAATLVADASDSGSSVITSLLDGFSENGGAAVGAAGIVLDCWSGLLRAYENGQSALNDAVKSVLNSISTNTSSGLGDWAADAFSSAMGAVGLDAVQLDALKPAIVNTEHVAAGDSGQFSVKFMQAKQKALTASSSSTDLFSALVASGSSSIDFSGISGDGFTIAEIEFPVGDTSFPITLALPQAAQNGAGFVQSCIDAISKATSSITGANSWQ